MNNYGFKKTFRDLTGERFGKWTVLKLSGKNKNDKLWLCRCECGKERVITQYNLTHGRSSSCIQCANIEKNRNKFDARKSFDKVISSLYLLKAHGYAYDDIIAKLIVERNKIEEL